MSAEDRNGEVSTDEKCTDCTTQERSFDELTRELASATVSRRGALRLLAGALFGGVLASVPGVDRIAGNSGEAQAQVPGPGGSTCANQGQSCTAQKCCEGFNCLTDLTNSTEKFCCSPLSQLVCGSSCCPTGALGNCSAGKCVCPTGEVVCPDANNPLAGKCVNLLEDPDNCGGCGTVCQGPTGPDAPCRVRACVNGGCTTVPNPAVIPGVTPCEDGDLCTLGDTCNASGQCVSGKLKECNQCEKCANVNGVATCVADTSKNDQTCSTSKCLVGETCQNGVCTGGLPKDCDDNNECTQDTCDPATGNCVHTKLTGTPCETGNKCTADVCADGVCTQGPQSVTCPQCQVCDPATGTCKAVANGTPCNDGDVCTLGDTCQGGTCQSGPVKTCDQCLECADVGGVATCVPVTNGTPCEDGNKCTLNDTCQAGVCKPGPLKDCSDNNECTQDSCDPDTGNCVHTPLTGTPCETGNKCTADTCQNGTCQQGPQSVTCPQCQVCDPATGTCKAVANGTPCNDGDPCKLGDTCQNGTCRPGTTNAPPGTPCGGVGSGRQCCAGTCCSGMRRTCDPVTLTCVASP